MISCKRATELISKSMEEELSLTETLSLRMHLFLCEYCELFKNQLMLIRKTLRHFAERPSNDSATCFTQDEKRELIKKLKNDGE